MNTLSQPAVAQLLQQLFVDAEVSSIEFRVRFGNMTPEERIKRMSDPNADFRKFYGMAKDMHLAVSPETGKLLYVLARGNDARNIVEFGTSFGISTIHLAAAIKDNGGGRLIGSEYEASKVAHAKSNLAKAGLAELADIREGDALETLAKDLPDTIDFVLLDGAKPLYTRVLDLVESKLRPGAILVADNADACPDYVQRVRSGDRYASLPFGEEVEVSVKVA